MSDAFKLQVPFEAAYRALGPEVASRYAELLGGSSADAAAFSAAIASVIDRLGAGAGPEVHVDLTFRPGAAGVQAEVSCRGRHETVKVKIPVVKR